VLGKGPDQAGQLGVEDSLGDQLPEIRHARRESSGAKKRQPLLPVVAMPSTK
jgi:hypothetical protein